MQVIASKFSQLETAMTAMNDNNACKSEAKGCNFKTFQKPYEVNMELVRKKNGE